MLFFTAGHPFLATPSVSPLAHAATLWESLYTNKTTDLLVSKKYRNPLHTWYGPSNDIDSRAGGGHVNRTSRRAAFVLHHVESVWYH